MLQIEPKQPGETNADYAYRILRESIVTMRLQPGSLIGEQEIAEQLQISRTPIRSALARLARVGMIETIPQVGNRVAMIDYGLIEEVRWLRLLMEESLLQEVCDKMTEADMERMRVNVETQKFYLEKGNQQMLMRLDNEFHRMFFEIAGKMLSYSMLNTMSVHFDRVRYISLEDIRDNKTVHDHENILNYILDHDIEHASELLTEHLTRFQMDRKTISSEYEKYIKK